MSRFLPIFLFLTLALPACAEAAAIGYSITVTTAYATSNPFPNRIDSAFTEDDTGYFQVANTGATTFSGIISDIAVSAFAGDLSFTSSPLVLAPGASVSIAIPDDASDVGGFNGPAYFFRPGVEIALNGTISNGLLSEVVALLVADANIHSGVPRTAPSGLRSDSFVLQGGDPWGFDPGDDYELTQANGVFVFTQSVPEPAPASCLAMALAITAISRRRWYRAPGWRAAARQK